MTVSSNESRHQRRRRPLFPDTGIVSNFSLPSDSVNPDSEEDIIDEQVAIFPENTDKSDDKIVYSNDEETPIKPPTDDGGDNEGQSFIKRVTNEARRFLKGGEVNDGEEKARLQETIYTLLFTAPFNSRTFHFSATIFCVIMAGIVLNIYFIVKLGSNNNPINVPPGVDTSVALAQTLALIAIIAWQADLISALIRFYNGYDSEVLMEIPTATRFKWHLSNAAQLLIGCGLLVDAFLIVVHSTSVNDVVVNLAGLQFLSQIGGSAFTLIENGPEQSEITKDAMKARELRVQQKSSILFCTVLYVGVALALLVPWGILNGQQRNGKFVCQSLYIQSGDLYQLQLPLVSGIYEHQSNRKFNVDNRVVYIYQLSGNIRQTIHGGEQLIPRIQYSLDSKAWTFVVRNVVVAMSPQTDSYDVTTTTPAQWLVQVRESKQFRTFDFFAMACTDCPDGGNNNNGGLCGAENGKCVNNCCVCNDGQYGLNCEFGAPCDRLTLDYRRNKDFPIQDSGLISVSSTFELLLQGDKNKPFVGMSYRPVYVFEYNSSIGGVFDVLMYLGRRWMIRKYLKENVTAVTAKTDLIGYLQNDFHPFYSSYTPFFLSGPTDFDTTTDAYTPVGLNWFEAIQLLAINASPSFRADLTRDVNSPVLLCSVCDDASNPCLNFGTCNKNNNTCECGRYTGSLCEVPSNCHDLKPNCDNYATCNADGTCTCRVNYGYYDDFCAFAVPCEGYGYTCLNRGTCNKTDAFSHKACACLEGFGGAYCEYSINTGTVTSSTP